MGGLDLPRHLPHVVALVAVPGEGQGEAVDLQIAQPGGQGEDVHLPPGIVDVILAGDGVARRLQHVGEAGAEGRAAPVAHMEGPRGIGGDELHLHLAALAPVAAPVGGPGGLDGAHHGLFGGGGEMDVAEAGPGDFGAGDIGRGGQRCDQAGGELAGIFPHGLGEPHGEVAGIVPMLGLLGTLKLDFRRGMVGRDGFQRPGEEFEQMLFHGAT